MCVLGTAGCSDTDVVPVMLLIARGKYPVVKSRKILTSCIHASVRQLGKPLESQLPVRVIMVVKLVKDISSYAQDPHVNETETAPSEIGNGVLLLLHACDIYIVVFPPPTLETWIVSNVFVPRNAIANVSK